MPLLSFPKDQITSQLFDVSLHLVDSWKSMRPASCVDPILTDEVLKLVRNQSCISRNVIVLRCGKRFN